MTSLHRCTVLRLMSDSSNRSSIVEKSFRPIARLKFDINPNEKLSSDMVDLTLINDGNYRGRACQCRCDPCDNTSVHTSVYALHVSRNNQSLPSLSLSFCLISLASKNQKALARITLDVVHHYEFRKKYKTFILTHVDIYA